MRVQLRRAVAGAAIGRGCQWSPLQSGHAAALPVPHRADTGPAADVAAGVRVLPGGVQRRAACPRQGIPGRDKAVGQRDSAAGDHPGQDHCGAGLAGRASQCGVGAVGQRLPSCVAQLLRLMLRQAGRRYGWSATHEIQEGSSAVVSAHAQRIQRPAEWAVVCGEGGRGAGALVARPARQTVECHDHPGTGRPLLRQFRRRRRVDTVAGGGAGGRGGCGHCPVGDDRGHRRGAHRDCEPETPGPQAAQAAAVGAGEVPPAERISQQGKDAAQDRHRAQRGGPGSAGLSPQAGFGVGSRETK